MVTNPGSDIEIRYACPPKLFAKHIKFLRHNGYNLISLEDIAEFFGGGTQIPANAVVVTFDDGFRDNYENAFPILQHYGVPATIFLTSGLMGKTNLWLARNGFPEKKMLTWSQVKEMNSAGISIGAHSASHVQLSQLPTAMAKAEIEGSKKTIEDHLGRPVDYFAYPYGQSNEEVRELVEEAGYVLACSTRAGFNNYDTNKYKLLRIEVFGTDSIWKLYLKLRLGIRDMRGLFTKLMNPKP